MKDEAILNLEEWTRLVLNAQIGISSPLSDEEINEAIAVIAKCAQPKRLYDKLEAPHS